MDPEARSPRYRGLDTWDNASILDALWEGQARAIAAVREALPSIAAAAEAIAGRTEPDGRLIYVGAGSSGQLAALDAMELPATFGWPRERVRYVRAENRPLPNVGEGAAGEDDASRGRADMTALGLRAADSVIAVAASGTTAYSVAAAAAAREADALVVAICNRADAPLLHHAHHGILLRTGAEVVAGSTRLNAGTAQKAALGLLSTLVMTRLSRVHDGLMVNMRVDRNKFSQRAVGIVAAIAGCSQEQAAEALDASPQGIKGAVLVAMGASPAAAGELLLEAGGNLRSALAALATTEAAL